MKVGQSEKFGIQVIEVMEPILDINNISDFRDILEERVRETTGSMILDLTATNYVGSVGLGAISLISIKLEREGRKFAVVVCSDEIKRLFEISGLRKVMRVEETLGEAVQKLASESS